MFEFLWGGRYGGTLAALSRTDLAICLPSSEALDKLALAQADLGRAFGKEESKRFAVWTEAMVREPWSRSLPLSSTTPRHGRVSTLALAY